MIIEGLFRDGKFWYGKELEYHPRLRPAGFFPYEDEPITDQTKIDLFEEINWLGTPQDISHMQNLKK